MLTFLEPLLKMASMVSPKPGSALAEGAAEAVMVEAARREVNRVRNGALNCMLWIEFKLRVLKDLEGAISSSSSYLLHSK